MRTKTKSAKLPKPPRDETAFYLKSTIQPKNEAQEEYIRAIYESDITICDGCSGTGKTTVAAGVALKMLAHNEISKILITRPVLEVGRPLGALPGYADEKVEPYMRPVLDSILKFISHTELTTLKNQHKIEIVPLELMRGTTTEGFVILDEAQNCTRAQLRMFVTRIGEGSKMVINGDCEQSDLPPAFRDNFSAFIDCLEDVDGISIITMDQSCIVRHPIIGPVLNRLKDF